MKNKKTNRVKEKKNLEVSAENFAENPQTVNEMINMYGTYNIQPTADTANIYPAIAQGENVFVKNKSLYFDKGENGVVDPKTE